MQHSISLINFMLKNSRKQSPSRYKIGREILEENSISRLHQIYNPKDNSRWFAKMFPSANYEAHDFL